jgi:catalase-peroxidase
MLFAIRLLVNLGIWNMNKTRFFSTTRIAGIVSLLMMSGAVLAETAEISKPKGPMGSGVAQANQAKTNQFWWPEESVFTQ